MSNSVCIYAAGPIDLASDTQIDWRSMLKNELSTLGVASVIFDPSNAFKCSMWGVRANDRSEYIENVNDVALRSARVFVAVVPSRQFSMGVPIEIARASELDKHMYIVTDIRPGKSVYLDNRVSVEQFVTVDTFDLVDMEIAMARIAGELRAQLKGE